MRGALIWQQQHANVREYLPLRLFCANSSSPPLHCLRQQMRAMHRAEQQLVHYVFHPELFRPRHHLRCGLSIKRIRQHCKLPSINPRPTEIVTVATRAASPAQGPCRAIASLAPRINTCRPGHVSACAPPTRFSTGFCAKQLARPGLIRIPLL